MTVRQAVALSSPPGAARFFQPRRRITDHQLVMSTPALRPAVAVVAAAGSEPVWIVPLGDHPQYDHVRLKRVFDGDDDTHHCVVMIDARKLLECANRDDTDYVLPPVGDWHNGKIRGIREFLDPRNPQIPAMPYVTIAARRTRTWLGFVGLEREGVVGFRNGQHRARYLAHAGADTFPVEVHEREARLLSRFCGAAVAA